MASPDFSEYINLRVNDLQPPELYAAAIDYARTALPEFEPRAGSVEDALLQACALINSFYIAAANRIPDGTIEGVLRLFGLERREAGVSTINATFTILTSGGSVEAGTAVGYITEENGELVQYSFFVRETATAAANSNTVNVVLESIVVGPLPVIPIGTALVISQPSSELLTCVTTSTPSIVTSDETDVDYLSRGVTFLNSLSNSLCTSSQIEAFILSTFEGVTRCKVYDLAYGSSTSPVNTTTTVSTVNGSVIDVVIDCSDENGDFFAFNDGLGLDIDGEPVWITTQASFDSVDITKDNFPSGLMSGDALVPQTTSFDYVDKTVTIEGMPVETLATSSTLGETQVQLVSGLTYSLLNNTAPKLRTPDARGMYVIFVWGPNGYPVEFDVLSSIYDELNARTPVGIDAFIHSVMPVDIYAEVEIEVLDGFVASSVILEVEDYLNTYFSPQNYPNWTEYMYRNEVVVRAAEVPGVKRVNSVLMSIPTYGSGVVTSTTGSSYLNNDMMASLDPATTGPAYIQFEYAGTMPKFTSAVSLYGA